MVMFDSNRALFRGRTKSKSNIGNHGISDGLWVTGYLRIENDFYLIISRDNDCEEWFEYEVDPETICQCTGVFDAYDKLIFEKDFLKFTGFVKNVFGDFGYVTYRRGEFGAIIGNKFAPFRELLINDILDGRVDGTIFDSKNREKIGVEIEKE